MDSYLDGDKTRETWVSTPFWNGEMMAVYKDTTCTDHCRELFTFRIGTKRFLLKADQHPDFTQCDYEIDFYPKLETQDRRYFVPVICGDKGEDNAPWVVCPLVPRLRVAGAPTDEQDTLIGVLQDKYNIDDLRFNSNWFIYNGRPLIVDYGLPLKRY